MREIPTAVVHFYRAIVMHADVWRERLDATTNWAVVTTVGVISFSFTRSESPHFIVLLLVFASTLFLIMESRRYQMYDLWRRRIRALNQYMIAPQLAPSSAPAPEVIERELADLADDLGRAVPRLHFVDAVGYRLRRNYAYIFLFAIGSWVLKLILHPGAAVDTPEIIERASMGALPGTAVMAGVLLFIFLVAFLALRAPSEQMVSWRQIPSPLNRLTSGDLFHRPMTEEEEERKATEAMLDADEKRETQTSADPVPDVDEPGEIEEIKKSPDPSPDSGDD